MESRVNLVETQAEMRGCDRIEQISPLNVIDVNKVKPSRLSSSSLGIKIIAVGEIFAYHVPDYSSFVASDVPAADSELPSTTTLITVPTETQQHQGEFALAAVALPFVLIRR